MRAKEKSVVGETETRGMPNYKNGEKTSKKSAIIRAKYKKQEKERKLWQKL